jgi:hypothetical protein
MDGWTDGRMDRWTDKRTNGQADVPMDQPSYKKNGKVHISLGDGVHGPSKFE